MLAPPGLHVDVDALGGAAQGELAQREQVAAPEEAARGPLLLLAQVDLAFPEPQQELLGREVHQHDLVGAVHDRVGDGLAHDRRP